MKKFITGLILGIMITFVSAGYSVTRIKEAYYNPEIKLRVDGEYIDVTPITVVEEGQVNGFNLFPVRALGEALGYKVDYDAKTKVIDLDKPTIGDVAKNAESCVMIRCGDSKQLKVYGSGVVVGDYIITSRYVLDGHSYYTVEYNDSTMQYEAERVYIDTTLDIGVLKSPRKVKGVELGDSDKVKVGEDVVLISCPYEIKNTVSSDIISGIRQWEGMNLLQAAIKASPGSSGGGLFDMDGSLIGIMGWGVEGEELSLSIAINEIKPILDGLK